LIGVMTLKKILNTYLVFIAAIYPSTSISSEVPTGSLSIYSGDIESARISALSGDLVIPLKQDLDLKFTTLLGKTVSDSVYHLGADILWKTKGTGVIGSQLSYSRLDKEELHTFTLNGGYYLNNVSLVATSGYQGGDISESFTISSGIKYYPVDNTMLYVSRQNQANRYINTLMIENKFSDSNVSLYSELSRDSRKRDIFLVGIRYSKNRKHTLKNQHRNHSLQHSRWSSLLQTLSGASCQNRTKKVLWPNGCGPLSTAPNCSAAETEFKLTFDCKGKVLSQEPL